MVQKSTAEANKFYAIESNDVSDFVLNGDILTFRSSILTETEPNNIVYAKVYEARPGRSPIVVLPNLNAETWSCQALCRRLMRLGLTAVELTLPYHGLRPSHRRAAGNFIVLEPLLASADPPPSASGTTGALDA